MFGRELEIALGRQKFLVIYFASGIYAGLCYCIYQYAIGVISYPAIGASGAIMGIMVIYALIWPNRIILLFFIIPMKVWVCVVILVVIDLLLTLRMSNTGIANVAHLGGALCGFCMYKLEPIIESYLSRLEIKKERKEFLKEFELKRRVNVILEKISREGMGKLTYSEKRLLKNASGRKKEEQKPLSKRRIMTIILILPFVTGLIVLIVLGRGHF